MKRRGGMRNKLFQFLDNRAHVSSGMSIGAIHHRSHGCQIGISVATYTGYKRRGWINGKFSDPVLTTKGFKAWKASK